MSQLGRIPKTGAKFSFENFKFEVVDMDGKRVDRVLVTPIEQVLRDEDINLINRSTFSWDWFLFLMTRIII